MMMEAKDHHQATMEAKDHHLPDKQQRKCHQKENINHQMEKKLDALRTTSRISEDSLKSKPMKDHHFASRLPLSSSGEWVQEVNLSACTDAHGMKNAIGT
jgi:nucleosome binding factor SPN SPT16 subunit